MHCSSLYANMSSEVSMFSTNRSSKYRYFFKKNNRQSIRDKYTTQLLRVESIRNAFNGILVYNICVTQVIFSSMQFNNICSYVLRCILNYEHTGWERLIRTPLIRSST